MSTRETLERARVVIEKPENWCIDWLTDRQTGAHCALGAIMVASDWRRAGWGGNESLDQKKRFEAAAQVVADVTTGGDWESVADYNNTHNHECVLAAFDAAIERSEA